MQWHSLSEFAAMGGYGLYVWGSLGACLAGMLIEPWLLRQRRMRILRTLQRLRIAEPSRPAPLADKPLRSAA